MQSGPIYMRLDLLESYVDVKPMSLIVKDAQLYKPFRQPAYAGRITSDRPDHIEGCEWDN